jgi:hypothetical protein
MALSSNVFDQAIELIGLMQAYDKLDNVDFEDVDFDADYAILQIRFKDSDNGVYRKIVKLMLRDENDDQVKVMGLGYHISPSIFTNITAEQALKIADAAYRFMLLSTALA